ncbi:MAG: ribosome recycling factor [candidate division FCPU426 bacterium]
MTANPLQDIQHDTQERMTKALEALKREFLAVRTGRASAAILEGIRVEYYNSQMPINQVATIVTPDAKTLEIKPWDVSVLGEIERTLLKANLGLTPINDGKVIRLSFPALTEERRKELVKHVQKLAEDIKVELRNHRRKSMESLKTLKKDKQLGEDDEKSAEGRIQKLTDDFIKQVDALTQHKEKELMEV